MVKTETIWYDPATTFSHNCTFNMVLSERGDGKTFSTLEFCVNRWLKAGKRFIYMRRTDVELKLCKDKLMDAITVENHYPNNVFKVEGTNIYCDDEIMGYCVPLSKAYQYKSTAFPDVETIMYDEFLIENKQGRYLPFEPQTLLSFMETVFRMRKVRIIMLANFFTVANVYFDYWQLYPKRDSVFTKHPTKPVLIHFYRSNAYRKKKLDSDMAKLVHGTNYGDFMLENKAIGDNYAFIEKPSGFIDYMMTFRFNGIEIGMWYSHSKGLFFMTPNSDPSTKHIMALDTDSHAPNLILLKNNKNHPNIKQLKWAIEHGVVRYENLTIKNTVLDMLDFL